MADSIDASNSVQATGYNASRPNSTAHRATKTTAETLVSRADGVTENLLGLLADYKKRVEVLEEELNTELRRGEEVLDVQNDIIAEKEDEIGELQKKLRDRKRKASDGLKRKDEEYAERFEMFRLRMEKRYERLIVAAKGVAGSNARDFGERVGELEGALNEL